MNKAILIGRLTRDPELNKTNTDLSVCKFTLAVNRNFKDKDGNEQTDFIPIVVWRTQAENCAKYLKKGSQCAVTGTIQTRSYDKDGEKKYITEIVADNVEFLSSAKKESEQSPKQPKLDDLKPLEDGNLPF